MVTTQANITFLNRDQSTTSLDRTLPTITTEPTLQWVVLIGIPRFEAHLRVLHKTRTHSTHALIFGAPRWIAVVMGNIHMKTSQEQK